MNVQPIGAVDWSIYLSQMPQKQSGDGSQAGFSMSDPADEPGTDTANISPQSAKELARSGGFSVQTTLTPSDKQMIKDVTGWDIDSDPQGKTASEEAQELAGRLNLDRYTLTKYGSADGFSGNVDQSYIQHVMQEQLGGQGMVSLSVLYKAQAYLSEHPAPAPNL